MEHKSEMFRNKVVKHSGKKTLNVETPYQIENADWNDFINRLCEEIQKSTVEDFRTWFEPTFSTTTPQDKVVGQLAMMGAMKKFFHYSGMSGTCGIPKVTLLGTLEDWKDIRKRIEKLHEFKLDKWADGLG